MCLQNIHCWFGVKWYISTFGTKSFQSAWSVFSRYFNILNLVFSSGPCSPTRETVMISAWQKREVSNCTHVVIKFLSSQCDIIKCVQEFHRQHTATALEYQHKGNASLCFLNPSFVRGKNVPSYTTNHSNHLTFPQCLCIRWRTGGAGWGTEQWESDVRFLPGPGSKFWPA